MLLVIFLVAIVWEAGIIVFQEKRLTVMEDNLNLMLKTRREESNDMTAEKVFGMVKEIFKGILFQRRFASFRPLNYFCSFSFLALYLYYPSLFVFYLCHLHS